MQRRKRRMTVLQGRGREAKSEMKKLIGKTLGGYKERKRMEFKNEVATN